MRPIRRSSRCGGGLRLLREIETCRVEGTKLSQAAENYFGTKELRWPLRLDKRNPRRIAKRERRDELIWFIWVCFVHLVNLVQPNRPNKQEKQAGPHASRTTLSLADFLSILLTNKTARPCVEHRGCHPNRVTFSNPSVARGRLLRASVYLWAPFEEPVPSGTDIDSASLEPPPRH